MEKAYIVPLKMTIWHRLSVSLNADAIAYLHMHTENEHCLKGIPVERCLQEQDLLIQKTQYLLYLQWWQGGEIERSKV
jgi:hypothetical protein